MEIPTNSCWASARFFSLTLLLTLTSGLLPGLSAAPVVTSVVNAASYADPNLPGSLIALGSIFIVKGTGLGPANITIAAPAFQSTSLSGTSVSVTVNSQTVNALMYYTSATQVAALLPSKTPTGGFGTTNPSAQVTITVTYNGETSAPTSFQGVGNSSAGIFTIDSSGSGPAIVTYPDYSLVSAVRDTNCGGPRQCGRYADGLGDRPGPYAERWSQLTGAEYTQSLDRVVRRCSSAGCVSGPVRLLHRVGSDSLHGSEQRANGLFRTVGD